MFIFKTVLLYIVVRHLESKLLEILQNESLLEAKRKKKTLAKKSLASKINAVPDQVRAQSVTTVVV